MKTIYTLLCLLLSTSLSFSQKVNYESSKWFWGLNAGSTWSSTDLKSENFNGFGLTLGRSYNYDYGRSLSFDIRGRFLGGQWYGQSEELTTLGSNVSQAIQSYLVGDQKYVHNFRADVRELNLELVLHAGKLRERTGLDPYIFGGLGLTWQQNWTDALDNSDVIYNYNALSDSVPLSEQLPGLLDNIYETRLDGVGNNNDWLINWMPSLGFGLAYHRGRVSIGLEHKTTFTMADNFDGLLDQTARFRNDWYHYTSAFIQIHFKKRSPKPDPIRENPRPQPNTNTVPNNNSIPCPSPEVESFFAPQNTVTSSTIKIEFTVSFINSAQDLILLNSLNQSIPFNYNSFSSRVEALVNLNPGINNFTLRATTPCGTDQQTIQINRENCERPAIQILNNSANNTVAQAAYNFTAVISGQVTSNQIQLIHNGMAVVGFSFNSINGQLQRQINLAPGNNIIRIEVNNACGNAAEQTNIVFNNCEKPVLTIINPSAPGTTTNIGTLALKVQLTGTTLGGQAQVLVNNMPVSNTQVTGGYILSSLQLYPGLNTIQVRYSNSCGTAQQNTTVNYQNCVAPVITVLTPSMNSTVQNSALRLRANLANVTNQALIKLLINGIEQNTFSFNNTSNLLEFNGQLNEGLNSITLTSANDCGTDIESFTVTYETCKIPTISLDASVPANNSVVTNSAFNLVALSTFLTQNQVTLNLNGTSGQPFTFQNGNISASLNLKPGANTIILQGKNECDRTSKTLNITFTPPATPCLSPTVNILTPAQGLFGVSNPIFQLTAEVNNMPSATGLTLLLNGIAQNTFVLNANNFNSTLNLNAGINTIKLIATNNCGSVEEERQIRYEPCDPPQVIYNMIATGSTVNNPVFTYYANVVNYTSNSNIILSINGTILSGYSNVNGSLAAELGLIEGNNQISITVTNDCGTFTNTYYVTYVNDGSEGGQKQPTNTTSKPTSNPVKPLPSQSKPTTKPNPTSTVTKPVAPKTNTTTSKPTKPQSNSPSKSGAGTQKPDSLNKVPNPSKTPQKTKELKSEKGGGR